MKSIVKMLLTLSLLLPLTGCQFPNWFSKCEKKEVAQEPVKGIQASHQQHKEEHVCTHPGCKKNHDKKHKHEEVEIQGIESEEVEIQTLDENDFDEDFTESDYTI
jgi:hypothetical protein